MLVLWALNHRYAGISRDATLYAFQALAKIHSNLSGDVYLAANSQDRYTLFSPLYARLIQWLGLQEAAKTLFLACTALYLFAAQRFSRAISNRSAAWLAVALLIIIPGRYGAFDVFNYSDDYLTARSLAVALVVVALALYFNGRFWQAAIALFIGMLLHPLMTFPAVLLTICLSFATRIGVLGAAAISISALAFAVFVSRMRASASLEVMDPLWLDIVRERSQFLFLNLWRVDDWELAARPFVSLTLTALVIDDGRIRKLCQSAILVGATGLVVAWIAGSIGPVALLVQGQAWRWLWLSSLIAVLMLAPTVLEIWRDEKCGPLCAVCLLAAWVWNYAEADHLLLAECALSIWLARAYITNRLAPLFTWSAISAVALLISWTIYDRGSVVSTKTLDLHGFFALGIPSVVAVVAIYWAIERSRSSARLGILAALLYAAAILVPEALTLPVRSSGTSREVSEFSDWRDRIPPNSNVLILPVPLSASFVWTTLNRPSYLSLDQSSGAVFSRATALEISRRSAVLLPLGDPNWKIMSRIEARKLHLIQPDSGPRRLTAESLVGICTDPQLGFVIAKDDVGFSPLTHRSGIWTDWNLYDCRKTRSLSPDS